MKNKKKISKTETGKSKSQVNLDPQLKKQNGLHSEEAIDLTASPIQEKALTIIQRQLRSRIFKRYRSKMERAREVSKRKLASPEKLKVRAERAARTILKKRFAGRKGTSYQDLSTSEKIQVDKRLEGKAKLIKKIAQRLVPKLRKMDIQRLRSFYQGKQLKHHTEKSPAPQSQVNESFEKMIKMFDNDDQNILKNMLNKDPNQLVGIIESMIGELENQNNPIAPTLKEILDKVAPQNPVYTCLTEKSSKSGIPFNILEQVFNRGLQNCGESAHQFSKEQYAFNRVNSYISKGKAYGLDSDLRETANISIEEPMNEIERTTDFKLVKVRLPDGRTVWRKERKEIKEISGEGTTDPLKDRQKRQEQELKIRHARQRHAAEIQNLKKEEVEISEAENAGLSAKAEKSGISIGVLRKVYNRGMAAWNSGHRPGTTPQQWGMARVNSYITKGKGTYYGADKDLHEGNTSNKYLDEKVIDRRVMQFAANAHELWRKQHIKDKGDVPRIKKNSDGSEGDINVPFHKLHPDWQKENIAAGHAVLGAIKKHPNDIEKASEHVHNEWMKRNPKADYNAAQHVPYKQLPEDEKEKDRVHVRTMMSLKNESYEEDISVSQNKNLTLNAAFIMSNMSESEQPIELTQLLALEHLIKTGFNMVLEEVDDEGKMAVGQLSSLIKNAQSLIKIMTDNKQLDGWVQAKITKASDYINSVQEYLDNNKQDVDE